MVKTEKDNEMLREEISRLQLQHQAREEVGPAKPSCLLSALFQRPPLLNLSLLCFVPPFSSSLAFLPPDLLSPSSDSCPLTPSQYVEALRKQLAERHTGENREERKEEQATSAQGKQAGSQSKKESSFSSSSLPSGRSNFPIKASMMDFDKSDGEAPTPPRDFRRRVPPPSAAPQLLTDSSLMFESDFRAGGPAPVRGGGVQQETAGGGEEASVRAGGGGEASVRAGGGGEASVRAGGGEEASVRAGGGEEASVRAGGGGRERLRAGMVLEAHDEAVNALCDLDGFDRGSFASVSSDKSLRVWDGEKGVLVLSVALGSKGTSLSAACLEEEAFLAAGSSEGKVYLFHASREQGWMLHERLEAQEGEVKVRDAA
eukprot:751982-Hanusia_phi.AAC.2